MSNGIVSAYNASRGQVTVKAITTFNDVGVGNAAIMYGTSIAVHRQLEIHERIKQCSQALVEAGFLKPVAAGSYFVATVPIDQGKGQIVITEEVSAGIPIEGNVAVVYGDEFDNVPASTLNHNVTINNLISALLDDVLSAA